MRHSLTLVDGFNVLHAVILRGRDRKEWWRAECQAQVVELAGTFRRGPILVVFDGSAQSAPQTGSVETVPVLYAPSADDFIADKARLLREQDPSLSIVVVSADRSLLDRARRYGAERLSPWHFAELCGAPAAADDTDAR